LNGSRSFCSQKYNEKVDEYSVGIILWQKLTEEKPFKNFSGIQVCAAVSSKNERPQIPAFTQKELKNLIISCWDIKPKSRPSFRRICQILDEGKAFYPGTDQNETIYFVSTIQEDDENLIIE
jgi:serine/threonine protein kinase